MLSSKVHNFGLITVAVLFVIARTAISLSANQGISYGLEVGDSVLNASDDGSSEEILLGLVPFIFYGNSESSVFVSALIAILVQVG